MAKDYKEQKDDFSTWCDMWDKACKKKIFPDSPKLDSMPEGDFDDAAEDYYNNIDREASEDGLLHEVTARDYVSANPIYPDTVGKDSRVDTKTSWIDERPLEALADLKRKLYDIECKLNAKDAGGSKWNKRAVEVNDKALWKQIHTLREKVDNLSNNIGFKDDPKVSLYRTK
jgi:hypothetical protein